MQMSSTIRKIVGLTAMISMPIAFINLYFALAAASFNIDVLDNPLNSIAIGADSASFIYWSMIFDMFGFYLLLVPTVIYLHFQLREDSPVGAAIISFGGLFYIMLGASGAAILSATWPELIREYSSGGEAERAIVMGLFKLITNAVFHGLWDTLEFIPAALWWCGIGFMFLQRDRIFGIASMVLGLCCLAEATGTIIGHPAVAAAGMNLYLILGPLWAFWFGWRVIGHTDIPLHSPTAK